MLLKILVACIFLVHLSCEQELDASFESLVDTIFRKPNRTVGAPQATDLSPSPGDEEECECVRYFLCNNGSIVKDGFGIIDIRLGQDECDSYLDKCCSLSQTVKKPILPKFPDKSGTCGHRNSDGVGFRITGDKDGEAQFGEFPWMVAVIREEEVRGDSPKLDAYQCGGSLIHRQVVLTAAHCVTDKTKKFKIRAGEWDTQTEKEIFPHQVRRVEKIDIHPDYYAGALFNDVALLYLDKPVDIAENVDLVCLPPQDAVINDGRCFASGWGKDVFGKEGKHQVILKKVELPMVPRSECQKSLRTTRLGKFFELDKSFVCAGGEAGKDTCKGDGGSPLVCPIADADGLYHQVGIVAWGIGCGEERIPGVYVNVPMFRDWIDQQLAFNKLDVSVYSYSKKN